MERELSLKEKVFTALGQASMCWSVTPQGVFDSIAAKKIGEELMEPIETLEKNTEELRNIYSERKGNAIFQQQREEKNERFRQDLRQLLNRYGIDSDYSTSDNLLASMMLEAIPSLITMKNLANNFRDGVCKNMDAADLRKQPSPKVD